MKILYLAHRIPYPPNKGDKIRSFNEIKHLSASNEIDLACLVDDPADMRYRDNLGKYCNRVCAVPLNVLSAKLRGIACMAAGMPLSVGYFYSRPLQRSIDQWVSETRYDSILCFSSPMAEYVFRCGHPDVGRFRDGSHAVSRRTGGKPMLVMDFCDVDSDKWAQYAERSSFPMARVYALESRRLAAYERRVALSFDRCVFVSEKEAELFTNDNPDIRGIEVIPNGVDNEYFDPTLPYAAPKEFLSGSSDDGVNSRRPTLVFTGAMDYHANVDGVIWFCREILPGIKVELPEVRFFIVGRNPHRDVLALDNGDSIRVTGAVDDIRPYYHHADVCVIPLRIARGVQNKVLEAMAMGKAVVATAISLQGIDAVSGVNVLSVPDQADFAASVLHIMRDDALRKELSTNARILIDRDYGWPAKIDLFNK